MDSIIILGFIIVVFIQIIIKGLFKDHKSFLYFSFLLKNKKHAMQLEWFGLWILILLLVVMYFCIGNGLPFHYLYLTPVIAYLSVLLLEQALKKIQ